MNEVCKVDVGDVIEWQGCPVLILGTPVRKSPTSSLDHWFAPAAYVRAHETFRVAAWDVMSNFQVTNRSGDPTSAKPLWTSELTDDEQVKIMMMILVGGLPDGEH